MFIDGVLFLWFILTLGSLFFVLYDQLTNTPSLRIMTLGWCLCVAYMGPLGLFFYFLTCRQPLKGTHETFIASSWKQSVGSLIHCVAGDATAIIAIVAILHFIDLPSGIEVIIEYIVAYLVGLLLFQALFMKGMFSSYAEAVKKTLFAETVSMNMVMTGMFPVIVVIKQHHPIASNPAHLYFWGMMSLATIVGSFVAYPINAWMVKKGLKHGMMSKGKGMSHHHTKAPSKREMALWITGTYLLFFITMAITSRFAPLEFA